MRASVPPPVAANVAYNIPRNQFEEAFGAPDDEGVGLNGTQPIQWYCSMYDPPPLDADEAWDATYAAADRAFELLMEQDFPLWTELHEDVICTERGKLAVYTDRRCIHLEIRSEAALSVEMLQGLQTWLAKRFPLHRIEIAAPERADGIVIYPQLVQVGDVSAPSAEELADELAANRKRRFASRSGRALYTVSQFLAVKSAFRAAWNETPAHGASIVAAFDSLRGKPGSAAVWLLLRGSSRSRFAAGALPCFPDARWHQTFAVDGAGRLGDCGGDDESEAWLCEFGLPAASAQGKLCATIDGATFEVAAPPLAPTPLENLARLAAGS